jgi:hypothetical protein
MRSPFAIRLAGAEPHEIQIALNPLEIVVSPGCELAHRCVLNELVRVGEGATFRGNCSFELKGAPVLEGGVLCGIWFRGSKRQKKEGEEHTREEDWVGHGRTWAKLIINSSGLWGEWGGRAAQQCRKSISNFDSPFIGSVSSRPALASIGDLGQSAHVKVREIVRRIEDDGWYWVRTRGSHHQYRHRTKADWSRCPVVQETILRPALSAVL